MRDVRRFLLLLGAALALSGGCGKPAPHATSVPAPVGPRFVDRTAAAGLHYRWEITGKRPLTILQTIGNGAAFLDFDGDARLDIALVGAKVALFQGDGKGAFVDVSAAALGNLSGHFLGVAVGDTDNDGRPDLYLTGYGEGRLLRNRGGRFEDVTKAAGLGALPWGTSASFADVDGDGFLDLYVGNYVRFAADSPQFCKTNGVDTACPPGHYDGVPGRLYRNLGQGRFVDATRTWGLDRSAGKTLGVAFADLDQSGRQSLALANDEVPGELFQNQGARFVSIGSSAGIAFSGGGQPQAGMGQDWGDYDNDEKLDLAVMTFSTELKPVYHNDGGLLFTDRSAALGLAAPMTPLVAFGTKWLDADNDGSLDLMVTNGHIADNIEATGQGETYRQPTQFFHSQGGKRFVLVPGTDLDRPIVGRGLATGDYDNDGKIDALVVDSEGAPLLLHNESAAVGHWVTLRLIGAGKSNRDAYGATVAAQLPGGPTLLRHVHADGSYLSSSDPRVHLGLGTAASVQKLTIRWPSGRRQAVSDLAADRGWTIEEGKAPR